MKIKNVNPKKKNNLKKYQHKDFFLLKIKNQNTCKEFTQYDRGYILWDFFSFLKIKKSTKNPYLKKKINLSMVMNF
nr:hypothetical protein CcurKRNrm1_p020 [Cryptomonas curvata]